MLTEQTVMGMGVDRIFLKDYTIQPLEDLRHTEEGFHDLDDDYNAVIDRVLECDILVFATPIY